MAVLDFAEVGQRLKTLRLKKGKKQREIAKVIGVTERAYAYYEAGEKILSVNALWTLAIYYDVSMEYIIGKCADPASMNEALVHAAKEAIFYLQFFTR